MELFVYNDLDKALAVLGSSVTGRSGKIRPVSLFLFADKQQNPVPNPFCAFLPVGCAVFVQNGERFVIKADVDGIRFWIF